MKRLGSLLLITTLLLGACDDAAGPTPFSGGTVSALIDGGRWSSVRANATHSHGVLSITSEQPVEYNREEIGIDLNITDVMSVGDYNLGGLSGNSGHVRLNGANYYTSLLELTRFSGRVTITQLTTQSVAGTFQFTAHINAGRKPEDSVVVTEGSFDLRITR